MSESLFHSIEPERVWYYFEEISKIPRCSQDEQKIREYLKKFAKKTNLAYKTDEIGNIVIKKSGTRGYEGSKTVVLQGHMDMVCEKNQETDHDFQKDPLKLKLIGDWVSAENTTLGADNGIAIAFSLAILESHDIEHGPIEALFTVDEESGLTGALQLDSSIIDGRYLINLDSEEEGVLYIGCAGGVTTSGWIPVEWSPSPNDYLFYRLSVTGLRGGHSGGDIHKSRGSAIKFGARLLWNLLEKIDIRIATMQGGGKHNAIPRELFLSFIVPKSQNETMLSIFESIKNNIISEYRDIEPGIKISLEENSDAPQKVLSPKASSKIVNCLFMMPHGVDEYSLSIPGMVETSTNLASVELLDYELHVVTSQRSSMTSKRDYMANRITALLRCPGARVSYSSLYPAWTADPNNPLIEITSDAYKELFNKKPKVTAIHAGLECGVISERCPDMTMISFGPNLKDVHTPSECMSIESVKRTWNLLLLVLKKIADTLP